MINMHRSSVFTAHRLHIRKTAALMKNEQLSGVFRLQQERKRIKASYQKEFMVNYWLKVKIGNTEAEWSRVQVPDRAGLYVEFACFSVSE